MTLYNNIKFFRSKKYEKTTKGVLSNETMRIQLSFCARLVHGHNKYED